LISKSEYSKEWCEQLARSGSLSLTSVTTSAAGILRPKISITDSTTNSNGYNSTSSTILLVALVLTVLFGVLLSLITHIIA